MRVPRPVRRETPAPMTPMRPDGAPSGEPLARVGGQREGARALGEQRPLEHREVGLDALFTLAGLHSFAQDQAALDERILKQLG